MLLVGLTGGIASGKSTVAARLVKDGAELIDADVIAREVVYPQQPAYLKIIEHFGSGILASDGFIDRAKLAELVFDSPDKRRLLNELTHPRVIAQIADRLELLHALDGVVILDVPLLVEVGVERGYQAVVVVACSPDIQVRRLMEQRQLTEAAARARIAAQAPLEDKLKIATHVIWNEGTVDDLYKRVDEVAEELTQMAREKAAAEAEALPND
jgi:dephospho-CoA kinase